MATVCALFHSGLAPNIPCPFCHHINNTLGEPAGVAGTPDPPNQAQYAPVAPGTVAAPRQMIGVGNAYHIPKETVALSVTTLGNPQPLSVTKFHVKVAHAYYSEPTPLKAQWAVFADGWFVAINHNKPTTFEQLKETFRAQGQAQYINFLDHITKPQGKGDWTLSINHLDPKHPEPQLWCIWKSELCIQDAVSLQDYPPFNVSNGTGKGKGKGKGSAIPTYPVTLLWYPRMEKTGARSYGGYARAEESLLPGGTSPFIISSDDEGDDLVSVSELFARADSDPAPMAATATLAAGAHKRQISEAIPREERPNEPETTPAAPQQ
jgi:hypothetical protein